MRGGGGRVHLGGGGGQKYKILGAGGHIFLGVLVGGGGRVRIQSPYEYVSASGGGGVRLLVSFCEPLHWSLYKNVQYP